MDVKLIERIEGALQFCAQFMDAVTPDAKKEGWWTKHDQHIRDEVSGCLSVLQQQMASPPADVAGMREEIIESVIKRFPMSMHPSQAASVVDFILAILPIPEPKTDAAVKALVEDMAWLVSEIETEFKRNKWKAFPSSKENLERFERIEAALSPAPQPDAERCPICSWPYAESREKGCVPGDCSYRPREGTAEYERVKRNRERVTQPDAAPADDIVARLRLHQIEEGKSFFALWDEAANEIERLRQPVAGDVVERVIDRNELAILLTRYGEFGTNQESNLNTALKAADAILKLIGGGK